MAPHGEVLLRFAALMIFRASKAFICLPDLRSFSILRGDGDWDRSLQAGDMERGGGGLRMNKLSS